MIQGPSCKDLKDLGTPAKEDSFKPRVFGWNVDKFVEFIERSKKFKNKILWNP